MFTQAMPALVNAMSGSMPQNAIRQLMQVLGNCNQPLEHRGPISINTSPRQSERGVYDGGRWDPMAFNVPPVSSGAVGGGGGSLNFFQGGGLGGGQFGFNVVNGGSIFNNNSFVDAGGGGGGSFAGSPLNLPTNNSFFLPDNFLFNTDASFITNNWPVQIIFGTPGFPGGPGAPGFPGRDGLPGIPGGPGIPGAPSGGGGGGGGSGLDGRDGRDGFAIAIGRPGRPGERGAAGAAGQPGAAGRDGIDGGLLGQGGYELVAGGSEDKTLFDTKYVSKCVEITKKYILKYTDTYYKYSDFEFDPESCELTYTEDVCTVERCVTVEECESKKEPCAAPVVIWNAPPGAADTAEATAVRALSGEEGGEEGGDDCPADEDCACGNLVLSFTIEGDDVGEVKRDPVPFTLFKTPTLKPKPRYP
jgi:hypothetical protein